MNTAQLLAALRAAADAVWPEASPNGIYWNVQIARVPFERKAADGQLPLVVIESELRQAGEEYGLTNRVKAGLVTWYYIGGDDLHPEDELSPKLEALREHLYDSGLTYGQIEGDPDTSFSLGLPPNQHFFRQQLPCIAGAVIARVVAGEDS